MINLNDDPYTNRLLESIGLLPRDVYNFAKINFISADLFSDKAVLLVFNLDGNNRSRWIPFTQLKKDRNNNIWIKSWLLTKIKSDGKNE
jgi:hypothetical protein